MAGDISSWSVAQSLVDTAVQDFGKLDILVNNAGVLRDRTIFNISEEEWDTVIGVHLKGHAGTSRFATAHWRDRSKADGAEVYGRVINTSSEAFLYGSAGQPNYAAAKAGIVALTLATAKACSRYGVKANAICPRARTAMTEAVFGAAPDGVRPAVGRPRRAARRLPRQPGRRCHQRAGVRRLRPDGRARHGSRGRAPVRRLRRRPGPTRSSPQQLGGHFADRDPALTFAADAFMKL